MEMTDVTASVLPFSSERFAVLLDRCQWPLYTHYGGYRGQALSGEPVILHYQHGRWTPDQLPADLLSHFDCKTSAMSCGLVLNSISMVSAQEGWATGTVVPPPGYIDFPSFGVLLHYSGGKWALVPLETGYLGSIAMRSASDG